MFVNQHCQVKLFNQYTMAEMELSSWKYLSDKKHNYKKYIYSPYLIYRYVMFSGENFIILLDLLTIYPWRNHSSDQNALNTFLTDLLLSFCIFRHTSSGFIYVMLYASKSENTFTKKIL